ncbi:MAG TPA: hypothetical protein VGC77_23370 [Rhodopseudomonas sp.]|uniref:hypothetical protein n=1 Tax=Rhodopseudomonas sp. TaxID=1078 RepID=UPI002ED7B7BA
MKLSRVLGLAAVAGLIATAAPSGGAQAASLVSPGIAAAVQANPSMKSSTEVRWHRGWHRHHGWRRHHWHRRHWR